MPSPSLSPTITLAVPVAPSTPPPPLPGNVTVHERAPVPPPATDLGAGPYRGAAPVTRPTLEIAIRAGATPRWFVLSFCALWLTVALVNLVTGGRLEQIAYGLSALAILYVTLATWCNRTMVTVDEGGITVRTGPIPAHPRRRVDAGALSHLVLTERRHRNGGTYGVSAIDVRGRAHRLLDGHDLAVARWLEHRVEAYLGIADTPPETAPVT